jgi:arylformamidase
MGARLIDISPLVSARIAVWPGDVAYAHETSLEIARGDNLTLGAMRTTFHVGAHADAPSHYGAGLDGIGQRPLDLYYGPCQVIGVRLPRGRRIATTDVRVPVHAPRVLFRTDSFPDPGDFTRDFNALSPGLVDALHAAGVRLVGIDTPSIDLFDDKVLESHQAVARHDMGILEGLVLQHVDPGTYTLIALPLRLDGADASPVRAALRRDDP